MNPEKKTTTQHLILFKVVNYISGFFLKLHVGLFFVQTKVKHSGLTAMETIVYDRPLLRNFCRSFQVIEGGRRSSFLQNDTYVHHQKDRSF